MINVTGKIALVTGATRGIGAAIATQLARHGAFVYGTATSAAGAAAITERFASEGLTGQGLVLDVTDNTAVDATIDAITEQRGAPTILINNAGITRDNLLLRMKPEEWDDIITTNLTPVYRLSKACLKGMMKARWGRIITISSVVAATGNAGQANYAAAKAGTIGFTKSLAKEIGSRGITVNVVAPGFIDTDMTRALTDAQREALLKTIPLNQLGTPDDIAHACVFLASDAASYITGETLHVNGGMYMA